MASSLPEVPPAFKPIQHYLKISSEYEKRDSIVSYYCKLYAMQKGMEIDRKSPECRNFLRVLMGFLEQMKDQLKNEEAVQSELVGQAHLEDVAVKLFFFADTEDRKSNFDKNVIKAFYTSSMLFDVLTTFGPLSDELENSRKYAKWKAAYIHNCMKSGVTPSPGPLAEASEELGISADYQFQLPKGASQPSVTPQQSPSSMNSGQPEGPAQPPPSQPYILPNAPPTFEPRGQPAPENRSPRISPNPQTGMYPQPLPRQPNFEAPPQAAYAFSGSTNPSGSLRPEDFAKAMKYCKFANSALQYEDAPTAILNLNKALKILTTGSE